MPQYTMSFTVDAGKRAVTSDHTYSAINDHAGIREGARLARHASRMAGARLLEVHVGAPDSVPFFNWGKDFSFSLEQAIVFYERAVPA